MLSRRGFSRLNDDDGGVKKAGPSTAAVITTFSIIATIVGIAALIVGAIALSRTVNGFSTAYLKVTGFLSVTCPPEGITLNVGPTRTYKKISDAIATWSGRKACPNTLVKIDAGTYVESIRLDKGASGLAMNDAFVSRPVWDGVTIMGDDRKVAATTYIDGHTLSSIAERATWTLTTDVPGLGPFTGGLLSDFSPAITYPFSATAVMGIANPLDACDPLTNDLTGKISLLRRGTCNFDTKVQNAHNAGAIHTVIYNTAGPGVIASGDLVPGAGVSVMFSSTDGDALNAAITASATPITVTLSVESIYEPAVGTYEGMVDIIHPGGNLAKILVNITQAPANFPLEQPNFSRAGIVVGDKILVSAVGGGGFGQPATASSRRTIIAINGAELTLNAPVDIPIDTADASFTFLPNVFVQNTVEGVTIYPALMVNDASVSIYGLTLEENPANQFNQGNMIAAFSGSTVNLGNMVADTNRHTYTCTFSFTNTMAIAGGPTTMGYGYPIVATSGRIWFAGGGAKLETLIHIGSITENLLVEFGADVHIRRLVAGHSDSDASFETAGVNVIFDAALSVVQMDLYGHPGSGLAVHSGGKFSSGDYGYLQGDFLGAPIKIQRNGYYRYFGTIDEFAPLSSVLLLDNTKAWFWGNVLFEDNIGELTVSGHGSTFSTGGDIILVNNANDKHYAPGSGRIDVESSTYAPNNIRTHIVSGEIDHAIEQHRLGAANLSMTIDPTQTIGEILFSGGTNQLYTGKTYSITNVDGTTHAITLQGGATFEGQNGNNQYKFRPNSVGHCFTIKVVSSSLVSVCGGDNAGTWSTVPVTKRSAPVSKNSTITAPPGVMDRVTKPGFYQRVRASTSSTRSSKN